MTRSKRPVVIDLENAPAETVVNAPDVPDVVGTPRGEAMQAVSRIAVGRPSGLARWFWGLLASVIFAFVSIAAWDFVLALLERSPVLGWVMTALIASFLCVLTIFGVREIAAFSRLRRIDDLQHQAELALSGDELGAARRLADRLVGMYGGRDETSWGRQRFAERRGDAFDASALIDLVEVEILGPLDALAGREVETAARQVATVTALVPLPLADVIAALAANLRMIRRIAEIYGGRSGVLGGWRLTRAVLSHLVATGAMAVGDDLLEPIVGGSIIGKLSRRFGEGLVNGALTARVGVAAMEVCRPVRFGKGHKPSVRSLVKSALTGLFSSSKQQDN